MFGRKNFCKHYLFQAFVASIFLLFFCEYVVYYIALAQCGWPALDPDKTDPNIAPPESDEQPVKALFLADTHLLGPRKGHWFDKLRREWQMYRSFQTAITLHQPDVIFILGDVFDEGSWVNAAEYNEYVRRFNSIFKVPHKKKIYVVAGNHDMGFHYVITPYLNKRFMESMKAQNGKRLTIRGNHFVLVNSMALEGDGCFLCKPTEIAINKISKQLKCSKGIGNDCSNNNIIKRYSRPILLQHYPMYRESDALCSESDQAPDNIKDIKFRERWECLSREATEQLLDILNPRLIIDGHTHYGCRTMHGQDILEVTIPSFSWRNINNPSYLMGIFTPNNYALSKCYMPLETTVIKIYIFGGIFILFYVVLKIKQRINHYHLLKLQ